MNYANSSSSSSNHVVLVDELGIEIGYAEKMEAHREGWKHRAFSIFLFNQEGQLLLQQRQHTKYHSGGLWTNTCCGHPRPEEQLEDAAQRRLWEEMNLQCSLQEAFYFSYQAELDHGLVEHELDHVFFGYHNGNPIPNPEEVSQWKWAYLEDILEDIERSPEKYTYWFQCIINRVHAIRLCESII
jgi:isopentenyl-diphosphate delta-isomerase